ncbi:ATP-binding protein [Rhodoplanes elegans]|uniref:histidine kinase n=1 Tax=Rhodoplanes elegans TaxID=29408 RepID=A0A327JUR8_9BRAD|nr:sensor histidine kinase [Rhodoplanes elegans]MBK5961849.1 ATP-binding protein [Rhodoplanes elegans]RAI30300.1 ATP-binding protein [Rhodoplanes elegans]
MRANSLALRLFLSATAWTVIILLATGISLSSLYRQAVERSFDRRLGVYLRTLVAEVAAPEEGSDRGPLSLGEPLFELPLSGWYWQITRLGAQKPETRSSRSLWDQTLPHLSESLPPGPDGSRRSYVPGPEDQRLRLVERTVDLGDEGRFLVSVAGDPQEIDEETRSFDNALAITFVMLAAVLLLITMFQVRFGLAPLKRISESLAAIRAGRSERLEGEFPDEIEPLARETNALIEANREIVERARTHVGNLAHALKTPLSVVVNEAATRGDDDPLARKVREQAAIMRDQVARHLERARLSARLTVVGTVTEVKPVVTALARTMEKLHHDRGLVIDADVPETLRFVGERQDLEEMVGNLVDNACKWAQGRVAIEALPAPSPDRRAGAGLRIVVDDDGPGLSEAEREQVARRGKRLDETKPGSGLGLSIVTELAGLYGGKLTLSAAPIGGLRAELLLPAG